MSHCPRCHQLIDSQALSCPHCQAQLKAFGHPGIPLYRSTGKEYLCETCLYHEDDTCNFPQRPLAKECTLYQNRSEPLIYTAIKPQQTLFVAFRIWLQQNKVWLIVLGLLIISLILTIL
ncbi:zinc ribbon domain-containing protein [Planktothrix agardhii]|jgi:C4-type Zn-finger protein|uniref:zinc ribbon domain-containing protein n=1 Tax=Planktothrix agardhii TaxID=1160 RepID=UPI001D0A3709|nr:zinc ribbon domain-containing protein [Planktothrix agardhii]MCB8759816.1 zinc ribbon domain-containing protein [Planktothrix agardhii 1813]